MVEGGDHAQWRGRLATVTFKEAEYLKLKTLVLKVINGTCNGG